MESDRRIPPHEAWAKMAEGYVYIDVRTEAEFADGHPAGAFNVPIAIAGPDGSQVPNDAFVSVVEKRFGKGAKLVVGCQAGKRSQRAAAALREAGFTDVFDQRAGWGGVRDAFGQLTEPGWARAGLPQEDGHPDDRSYAALKGA